MYDDNGPALAATTLSLTFNPCATSSTYNLVAASLSVVGVARDVIRLLLTSRDPAPVGTTVIELSTPVVVITMLLPAGVP